jgi:hypothetical protein
MAVSDRQRRERVDSGSRRKRDLAAIGAATPADVSRARFKSALEWAEKHLPDEYAPFAASSALTIRALQHRFPSPDEVRDRLKAQGRDKATLTAAKEGA